MGLKRTLLGVVGGMVVVVLLGSAPAAARQLTADLSIIKTGPASLSPGSNVSFTLTATNSGGDPAIGVVLSDTLPTGVTFVSLAQDTGSPATLTTPAVGRTGTVTATWINFLNAAPAASFTLTVNVSAGFSGDLVNTATITSESFDANLANNSSTVSVSGPTTTTSTTTTTTSTTPTSTTTTTSTTPTSTTTTTPAAAPLAVTGGGSRVAPIAAVALLFAGVLLILASRRRIAGR